MTKIANDQLILDTINWVAKASDAFNEAGGDVMTIMDKLDPELVITLIRNNIFLKYEKSA